MKTLIIVSILLIGMFLITQCNIENDVSVVSILHDITDEQNAFVDTGKVKSLFDLDGNQWNGAVFRYSTVSDVSLNERKEYVLKPAMKLLSNEFDRAEQVTKFSSFIDQTLRESKSIGKERSSVYLAITRELIALIKIPAQEKVLVVYSDLMENGRDFSMYDSEVLKRVSSDPKLIRQYFENKLPLPRLDGVTIYLIYQPTTTNADDSFQVVSSFYKSMLEAKGAVVHIQANI